MKKRPSTRKLLTPAEWVVRVFGGIRPAARALGKTPQAIGFWLRPKSRKGTDGRVPSKAQQGVLRVAKRLHLDVTEADLINGRVIRVRKPIVK